MTKMPSANSAHLRKNEFGRGDALWLLQLFVCQARRSCPIVVQARRQVAYILRGAGRLTAVPGGRDGPVQAQFAIPTA